MCNAHFVSDDPLSPDFVPTVFSYVHIPENRRVKRQLEMYKQRMHSNKRCLQHQSKREVCTVQKSGYHLYPKAKKQLDHIDIDFVHQFLELGFMLKE